MWVLVDGSVSLKKEPQFASDSDEGDATSCRQTNMLFKRTHSSNRPPHKTFSDKPLSLAQSPTLSAPTASQSPESTSASTPANDRVAAATLMQVWQYKSGTTAAHWSMFGDQQPKRKGISKESDTTTSEPGEAKLLDAVVVLTLNLESERRATARDQNTVFKIRKDNEPAGFFQEGIEAHTIEGQNGQDAAKNNGEQYQGHPQGKRPDALLRSLLWRVAQLITDEARPCRTRVNKYCSIYAHWGMWPRPMQTCGQQCALLSQLTTITFNGYGLLRADLSFESWDGYHVLVGVFGTVWHRNRRGYGADEQAGLTRLKALE